MSSRCDNNDNGHHINVAGIGKWWWVYKSSLYSTLSSSSYSSSVNYTILQSTLTFPSMHCNLQLLLLLLLIVVVHVRLDYYLFVCHTGSQLQIYSRRRWGGQPAAGRLKMCNCNIGVAHTKKQIINNNRNAQQFIEATCAARAFPMIYDAPC